MPADANQYPWNEDSEDIVQRPVQAVAVYLNPNNHIVIRQEADWPHEEQDTFVIVSPEAARRLAPRLLALADEAEGR